MRAVQRNKAAWGDLAVVGIVLLAAAVLAACLLPRAKPALSVEVMLEGEVILTCSLDELEETMYFPVDGPYPLTLELSAQGVRVAETTCPGKDCFHAGESSQAGRQIICLPNHLVVTLKGNEPTYDAIVG